MSKIILTNCTNELYLGEKMTIYVAIMINFAWVTIASIVAVAVTFKKFEVNFNHESTWAIGVLCIAFCIFSYSSWLYGELLYGGVFVCYIKHIYIFRTFFDTYNLV